MEKRRNRLHRKEVSGIEFLAAVRDIAATRIAIAQKVADQKNWGFSGGPQDFWNKRIVDLTDGAMPSLLML